MTCKNCTTVFGNGPEFIIGLLVGYNQFTSGEVRLTALA